MHQFTQDFFWDELFSHFWTSLNNYDLDFYFNFKPFDSLQVNNKSQQIEIAMWILFVYSANIYHALCYCVLGAGLVLEGAVWTEGSWVSASSQPSVLLTRPKQLQGSVVRITAGTQNLYTRYLIIHNEMWPYIFYIFLTK